MKKYLLLPLLALAVPAAAQQTEFIGRAGLGLMQFGGRDALALSQVNYSNYGGLESGYTNSPYGHQLGTGFAGGVRVQHVGRRQGLLALDLGYEWLRSRTTIDYLNYYDGISSRYAANGTTHLQTSSLTGFVGFGYRFQLAAVAIDALVGPELAYVSGFHEKGHGTYDGGLTWATDVKNRSTGRFDSRLRADATVWRQRLGFTTSYSYGFINYQSGLVGGSREACARILRLGLAYRLR